MVKSNQVLAIIPARGGSKRLPRKNILPLGGKPLIAWTIEAAIKSRVADTIVVSSDDDEILAIAAQYKEVTLIKRNSRLATDVASTIDVVLNVLEHQNSAGQIVNDVLLLQPTSPLRKAEEISDAYRAFRNGEGNSVVSVCEVDHPLQWCGIITDEGLLSGFDGLSEMRSQDYPISYRLNGAIYIADANTLKTKKSFFSGDIIGYRMARETSVDIDSHLDFMLCDLLIQGITA